MDNNEISTDNTDEIFAVDSQIELLNLIQTHVDAQVPFICVEGAKGSGKSWLSQNYLLIDHGDERTQALLICTETQTLTQQRDILLGQLLPNCMTEDDSLTESMISFRSEKPFSATIVIDDTEQLKPELLQDLSQVMLNAQQKDNWKISIVFFAQTDYLTKLLANVENKSEVVLLSIEPFNEQEKENFAEAIIFPLISNEKAEEKIKEELAKTPSYPANLLQLADRYKKRPLAWIRPFLIAILVITVMLGWLTSWYNNYNPSDSNTDNITVSTDNNTSNTDSATEQDESATNSSASNNVADGTQSLPPQVAAIDNDNASNNNSDSNASTNTTNDASNDSASSNHNLVANNSSNNQTSTSPSQSAASNSDVNNNNSTTNGSAENAGNTNASQPQANTSSTDNQWDNQVLLDMPANRYTIQVATFSNSSNAAKYPSTHNLQDGARIYSANYNDKTYYVVTYKDFASISEAQNAISTLSEDIKKNEPWVKSIGSIHNEIKK